MNCCVNNFPGYGISANHGGQHMSVPDTWTPPETQSTDPGEASTGDVPGQSPPESPAELPEGAPEGAPEGPSWLCGPLPCPLPSCAPGL